MQSYQGDQQEHPELCTSLYSESKAHINHKTCYLEHWNTYAKQENDEVHEHKYNKYHNIHWQTYLDDQETHDTE